MSPPAWFDIPIDHFHVWLATILIGIAASAHAVSILILVYVEFRFRRLSARTVEVVQTTDWSSPPETLSGEQKDEGRPEKDETKDEPPPPPDKKRRGSKGGDEAEARLRKELAAQQQQTTASIDALKTSIAALEAAQKTSAGNADHRAAKLSEDLTEIYGRLEEYSVSMDEERRWFERIAPMVEPQTARDLILLGGGFSPVSPDYWAPSLEKKWSLVQRNRALRDRLLVHWTSEPVQRIGVHYRRLLKISYRQFAEARSRAGGLPPRLLHWRQLHRAAKRHFVGVSNFFARLARIGEPGFETFASSIRGMTHAEHEIGWSFITDPATSGVVLAGSQLDDFVNDATRKLLETWPGHVLRLHQELFEIPGYEWTDRSALPDELDQVEVNGEAGMAEEDVRAVGRLLGYELIDLPPYGVISADLSKYINVRATRQENVSEWLGYERRIGSPVILRLQTLAWKRRQGSEMLNGGAEIIVGKDADA